MEGFRYVWGRADLRAIMIMLGSQSLRLALGALEWVPHRDLLLLWWLFGF
jgi:hypothetical protein